MRYGINVQHRALTDAKLPTTYMHTATGQKIRVGYRAAVVELYTYFVETLDDTHSAYFMAYTLYESFLSTGNMGARLLEPDSIITAPRKEVTSIQRDIYSVGNGDVTEVFNNVSAKMC